MAKSIDIIKLKINIKSNNNKMNKIQVNRIKKVNV